MIFVEPTVVCSKYISFIELNLDLCSLCIEHVDDQNAIGANAISDEQKLKHVSGKEHNQDDNNKRYFG